jgi:hypothetical protein
MPAIIVIQGGHVKVLCMKKPELASETDADGFSTGYPSPVFLLSTAAPEVLWLEFRASEG